MIAVIDYDAGNLFSVANALERLGIDYVFTADPAEIEKADGIILPGVGAFPDAMEKLSSRGLVPVLQRCAVWFHPTIFVPHKKSARSA